MWGIAPVDGKSKKKNIDNFTIVSEECCEETEPEQELEAYAFLENNNFCYSAIMWNELLYLNSSYNLTRVFIPFVHINSLKVGSFFICSIALSNFFPCRFKEPFSSSIIDKNQSIFYCIFWELLFGKKVNFMVLE